MTVSITLRRSAEPVRGRCVIGQYQYLMLMAACLLVTLPLEFVLGARVYRRFGSALIALLPVVLVFSVWDIIGIVGDHWTYSPRFVTGLRLVFDMPLEELVFFVVIPICGLLTYEAVGMVMQRVRRAAPAASEDGYVERGPIVDAPRDAGIHRDERAHRDA